MLLFYFSGHGVLDENGRLYLAVKDTDTGTLRGTAIPARYITEEMDNSRSKRQVLILDCCHSGAFERGTKGAVGASVGTANAFEGSGFGRVVLTASDATQYAWEGDQVIGDAENSLFTHFVIKGIQTGVADTNGDGIITVDELYDYVFDEIFKMTPKQTPGKWSFKEQGDLIISRSPIREVFYEGHDTAVPAAEQHLYKLYNDGLSAFLAGDWVTACQNFENFLAISPDKLDAEEKLSQANRYRNYEETYTSALELYQKGDLAKSVSLFENLQLLVPGYKDVAQRLEAIRGEKELSDFYHQAKKLLDHGYYDTVIEIFKKIYALSPDFEDNERIYEKAENEANKLKHIRTLEDNYRQAMLDLEANRLVEAKKLLLQIQEMEKGYRATEQLLERVNMLMAREGGKKAEEKEQAGKQIIEGDEKAADEFDWENWSGGNKVEGDFSEFFSTLFGDQEKGEQISTPLGKAIRINSSQEKVEQQKAEQQKAPQREAALPKSATTKIADLKVEQSRSDISQVQEASDTGKMAYLFFTQLISGSGMFWLGAKTKRKYFYLINFMVFLPAIIMTNYIAWDFYGIEGLATPLYYVFGGIQIIGVFDALITFKKEK
jgi:hypothetical protein